MDVAHLPYVLDGCTGMGHRGSVRAGERPRRDLSPICRTGLARTAVRKRNGGDAFGSISGNTSTITVSTSSSETYRQRNSAKALPIRGLDILDAFKCNDCNFISRSKVMMRRHEHPEPNPLIVDSNASQQWQLVKVQHWTTSGKGSRYWIVKSDVDIRAISNAHRNDGGNEDCSIEALLWEDRMERVEQARLRKQDRDRMAMTNGKNADDTTPWLLRTKWPQTFAGKSLTHISVGI